MKTDQLIRVLAQDLATPAVDVVTVLRRALLLAFGFTAFGWLALAGMRADLMTAGLRPTLAKVILGVILAAIGFAEAARLSRPEQLAAGSFRHLLLVPVLAMLAVIAELLASGMADWSARLKGHSIPDCLIAIPLLSAIPMAAAFFALRRGATAFPTTAGALTGIGSSGLAIIAYGLFCNEDSTLFIATWYVLASAIAGLFGAAVGRMALRW